jgi:surface carbohydrate biosynthesis protein
MDAGGPPCHYIAGGSAEGTTDMRRSRQAVMPGMPLYLAIEEASRELPARLLIALFAAERGFVPHIGTQWAIWDNLAALAPGIILFKGNNFVQATRMRAAADAGHAVASIEEELFGRADIRKIDWDYMFNDLAAESCDLFLLQGESQRDGLAQRFPSAAGRMAVVGNPRADLLSTALREMRRAEADRIRDAYGDFLLVNTNFSSTNPGEEDAWGTFSMFRRVGVVNPADPPSVSRFFEWCAWERGNFQGMTELLGRLAGTARFPIVVRPHPTENVAAWQRALSGLRGVQVLREGDHIPWTMAARMLAHSSCTTGLEAHLLGTPSLSLRPGNPEWNDRFVSNHVNAGTTSAAEAAETIEAVMAGRMVLNDQAASRERLLPHLLVDSDRLASERVLDALVRLVPKQNARRPDRGTRGPFSQSAWRDTKVAEDDIGPPAVAAAVTRIAALLGRHGDYRAETLVRGIVRIEGPRPAVQRSGFAGGTAEPARQGVA